MLLYNVIKSHNQCRDRSISNAIPTNKKVTMQTSALKNQKTSGGFGNFHTNDREERGRIRRKTLHLVFCHFKASN